MTFPTTQHMVTMVHLNCRGSHGKGKWANLCTKALYKHHLSESSTLLGRTYHPPFRGYIVCPLCSSYNPALLCMVKEQDSPLGRFHQTPNQLNVCCRVIPRRLWHRTGGWAGGWVNQDGFPTSSLCRGEASRSFIPSEVPMVLQLQDQYVPSVHPVGRDGCFIANLWVASPIPFGPGFFQHL